MSNTLPYWPCYSRNVGSGAAAGVSVDAQGAVYVLTGAKVIQKYTSDGTPV